MQKAIVVGDEFLSEKAKNDGDILQADPLNASNPVSNASSSSAQAMPSPVDFRNEPIEEKKFGSRKTSRSWKPTSEALESFPQSTLAVKVPTTYAEAMASPEHWQAAIDSEILSHIANQTVEECTIPADRKPIPFAWVFKLKCNPDGTVRYKARIVMQGFRQRQGIDFKETFAPVAKWTSIRVLLALSTIFDWHLTHVDFETAFMVPKIDAEVYIKLSDGMQSLSKTGFAKMLKGVNGCRQGSKLFYDEVKDCLLQAGFKMSIFDSCVFILTIDRESITVITWVDDFLIAYSTDRLLENLLAALKRKYKFKIFGSETGKQRHCVFHSKIIWQTSSNVSKWKGATLAEPLWMRELPMLRHRPSLRKKAITSRKSHFAA